VTTVSPHPTAGGSRARRSTRPSSDEREQAILNTAETLLEDRGLADISVDDLARGAGLSRPAFYFYFPSKDAVLLRLFQRVVEEADATVPSHDDLPRDVSPAWWRAGIRTFMVSFRTHRAVTLAAMASRPTSPELGELWSTFMSKWVARVAEMIEAERTRGAAPVTIDPAHLSASLNLMNERVMVASLSAERPGLPEEDSLDALVHVWVTSIYGQLP